MFYKIRKLMGVNKEVSLTLEGFLEELIQSIFALILEMNISEFFKVSSHIIMVWKFWKMKNETPQS